MKPTGFTVHTHPHLSMLKVEPLKEFDRNSWGASGINSPGHSSLLELAMAIHRLWKSECEPVAFDQIVLVSSILPVGSETTPDKV